MSLSKKQYWGEPQEEAIKKYLATESEKEKNYLFRDIIDPAVKKMIEGVYLYVEKKFGKITSINNKELKENAYLDLLSKLHRYTDYENKAFSYYQTIVKNYILGEKIKSDNINKNKVDYVDVKDLGEYEKSFYKIDEKSFEEFKKELIDGVKDSIKSKNLTEKEKKVGYALIYMLENWHKIDFNTKNEFIRKLKGFSACKDILVAKAMKKFKKVYENIKKKEGNAE